MTTAEERMKILSMIQDGTITAEEGMRLLETLDESPKRPAAQERPTASSSSRVPFDSTYTALPLLPDWSTIVFMSEF